MVEKREKELEKQGIRVKEEKDRNEKREETEESDRNVGNRGRRGEKREETEGRKQEEINYGRNLKVGKEMYMEERRKKTAK